jgi:hypothetical protein
MYPVLSCDGGAAVIENRDFITRGAAGSKTQIVINDGNIIRYFNQAGAINSTPLGTQWIGYSEILPESQWQQGRQYSFRLSEPQGNNREASTVTFDGSGVSIQLHSPNGDANWYFHSCTWKDSVSATPDLLAAETDNSAT